MSVRKFGVNELILFRFRIKELSMKKNYLKIIKKAFRKKNVV